MYNYYEVFHRLVHFLSTTFFFLFDISKIKTKTLSLNIKYPLGHFIVLPLSMSFQTHPRKKLLWKYAIFLISESNHKNFYNSSSSLYFLKCSQWHWNPQIIINDYFQKLKIKGTVKYILPQTHLIPNPPTFIMNSFNVEGSTMLIQTQLLFMEVHRNGVDASPFKI